MDAIRLDSLKAMNLSKRMGSSMMLKDEDQQLDKIEEDEEEDNPSSSPSSKRGSALKLVGS